MAGSRACSEQIKTQLVAQNQRQTPRQGPAQRCLTRRRYQALAEVDVLINNAGLALGLEPAQRADLDQWQTMIDTNCTGLVTMSRTFLPGMVERKRGHVINLGSVAGNWPCSGGNVYGATKDAVQQFSRNLRADLSGTAVRVTNVEPGMCGGTEFSNVRFGDAEKAAKVYEGVQFLTPEDHRVNRAV